MKLAITQPWASRQGGSENMLWTFLRHVDRSRIEPTVIFFEDGPFVQEVAALGIASSVVRAGRLRQPRSMGRTLATVAGFLRREKPDLLLNWMAKAQLYGSAAALLAGMADRVIWWQHEVPNGHWIDRFATRLPARAVGCSSYTSARAQARLRPARSTFVVHPGIDSPIAIKEAERSRLRRELGVLQRRLVVGIVGRLQASKGQHHFLHAIAALRNRGHDVHGLVVGGDAHRLSPDYEPWLHQQARSLGLTDAVTFAGQVTDATPYMQVMDVLVSASNPEPFGIVLLEAMALGVPVLAFAAAGPTEIIEPGVSGLLVAPGDQAALVAALDLLTSDDRLRRRLAAGGRKRYDSMFTADRMSREMERRFEVVCHE